MRSIFHWTNKRDEDIDSYDRPGIRADDAGRATGGAAAAQTAGRIHSDRSAPPQEQLPAAPLLVGAYAFVLLMLFGYLVMVSRRLTTIRSEVDRLDADLKRAGKG